MLDFNNTAPNFVKESFAFREATEDDFDLNEYHMTSSMQNIPKRALEKGFV